MSEFYIEVSGSYKGRGYELDFALDRKPKKLISLYIPGSDDEVEITPIRGRKFGDAAETPARIKVGKWQAPAMFEDKGSMGLVFIGTEEAWNSEKEAGQEPQAQRKTPRRVKRKS